MSSNAPVIRPQTLRRAISNTLKGSAGNLVEWYDVYVYSVFAVYFEKQFFSPEQSGSQLYVWAIFAVTFLMRPVGSLVFGRIADRYGRRTALTASITLMACCSLGVALIPTHDVIGVWAAVALVVFRLAQGMATGGEYGASATYMSEAAPAGRRGFFSSFQYVTLVGGHVLAQATLLVMVVTLPTPAIESWGWRVAFAIGGVAAVVVFWLRRSMDESLSTVAIAAVRTGQRSSAGTLRELFRNNTKPLILCFLITMGGTLAFYAYTVNGPKIIQAGLGTSSVVQSTLVNLAALVGLMLLQPLGGWLSDRIGRKPLLVFFGIGGVAYTWFLYTALPSATTPFTAFAILFGGFIILTGYTSINAIVKAELFPSNIRALGVGFGYAVANSVFGGTAPLLFSAAKEAGELTLFIGYVTVVIAASLIVYVFALSNRASTMLDQPESTTSEPDLVAR
ncbi:MFS transporter [Leifsonia soli]|uniref:Alpha-ketoglutarate permease n=1 Tax=Leifsonia soli TaxID=582665 RepID=A0A852T1W7_9MICO|nr:MFS transporter [Leifsonia soli]NYD74822.1 MHS family alpha-ketoglutarate permease-like MFS transporter [Leifsonia soli]